MRFSRIRFTIDAHGRLQVDPPRAAYRALAALFAVAGALMFTRWGRGVAGGLDMPAWAWWAAIAFFIVFAVVFGAQARWGPALVFDVQRAAILRGERVVARFADVSHVEVLEHRSTDRQRYWVLRVHRSGGHPIFIGRESDKDEADRAGARLATELGKPARYVVW